MLRTVLALLAATACAVPAADSDEVSGGGKADGVGSDGCDATDSRSARPYLYVAPTMLQERMTDVIRSATASLDLQMYLFTVTALADELVAAKDRGVAVRVILDRNHVANATVRARLHAAGVDAHDSPAAYPYSHAKYAIVDHEVAMIQSANFNAGAMDHERNYGVMNRDAADIEDLQAIFDADWVGGPQPDLSCTRLIVSPINARDRIAEHIASADTTLELEVLYLTDTATLDEVLAARARGVRVRVLLGDPAKYEANETTATKLRDAGSEVKLARDPATFVTHAKIIVADGDVLVGSQNLSATSLDKNREVGLLVTEATPAGYAARQFETDWLLATP